MSRHQIHPLVEFQRLAEPAYINVAALVPLTNSYPYRRHSIQDVCVHGNVLEL